MPAETETEEVQTKPCECGCGEQVTRSFRPGHDSRLKSRLRAAHKEGNAQATAELKERGWSLTGGVGK